MAGSIIMSNYADNEYIFEALLEDASTMNKILHELHHPDDQSVLPITSEGLRLITTGEKAFQISAFFAASTFHKFNFNSDYVNFRLSLKDFIESLNLLRDEPIEDGDMKRNPHDDSSRQPFEYNTTSLLIRYRNRGLPLELKLENKSNYLVNGGLKAFNLPDDSRYYPIDFKDDEEIADIVFDSKRLWDWVSGLDLVSSEFVDLVMGKSDIPVRFLTKSFTLGEAELELSADDTEMIRREIRVSDNVLYGFSYRTQFMKPALEALKNSTFMKMRCGSSGLLCIEHFHGVKDVNKSSSLNCVGSNEKLLEYMTDYNQPRRKISSVEYFILSESKPSDV